MEVRIWIPIANAYIIVSCINNDVAQFKELVYVKYSHTVIVFKSLKDEMVLYETLS